MLHIIINFMDNIYFRFLYKRDGLNESINNL